jgi:hypothetical protein
MKKKRNTKAKKQSTKMVKLSKKELDLIKGGNDPFIETRRDE